VNTTTLGNSDLQVPRLGVGAMTWGNPSGLARLTPAKLAYGGAHGLDEEQRALEVSPGGRCDFVRYGGDV
jgi:aryl-alcohol dehydrogenase-like predicted oxidoreductase